MLSYVFPLRYRGSRLNLDQVMRAPASGFLLLEKRQIGYSKHPMWARLLGGQDFNRELLPYMVEARIVKINHGILIAGIEEKFRGSKSKAERWRQSWWCTSTREEGVELMQRITAARPGKDDLDAAIDF